jgi:hypothetical protein
MILGSLVHTLVLTPNEFNTDFFLMPDLNLRTNEGKAKKEELLHDNPNKQPVTHEQLAIANAMRSSINKNEKAIELLSIGKKEQSYFWECPFSNLMFKAKADHSSNSYFCELKTTQSANKEIFERHSYNMNYDLSLFHYREGIRILTDYSPKAYYIVIESEAPYVSQVYEVGESVFETGNKKWLDAVNNLENGVKRKEWPGYYPDDFDIPTINSPSWSLPKNIS